MKLDDYTRKAALYGIRARKASVTERYYAPSAKVQDDKHIFGWPLCVYMAVVLRNDECGDMVCGGGQTKQEAIACAVRRIERIGVAEFERQRLAKE